MLNEADHLRDKPKYLCTLQQGISGAQMDEMQVENVILVVPKPYIVTYPKDRRNMAAIRSKDTRPEIYFRKLLFAQGYRYSLNSCKVPGHPNIYLRKYNTAIFVHGCFWHRHSGCQYAYMPKSRVEFWQKKFEANVKRDYVVRTELQDKGMKNALSVFSFPLISTV